MAHSRVREILERDTLLPEEHGEAHDKIDRIEQRSHLVH